MSYSLPLRLFFFLLVHVTTWLGLIAYLKRLDGLVLKLSYIEGTTDMILEQQQEQHALIVALVENN
jgi:hypothetical protein